MLNNKLQEAAPSQPRRVVRLACAVILLLFIIGGRSGLAVPATASASQAYAQDYLDALAFLNEIRVKSGVKPLTLNANLVTAAELHAEYYNINEETARVTLHIQEPGKPGFTGVWITDRLKAAGWNGFANGEVMHHGQASSSKAVQGWLDTAYHRKIVLSPNYDQIGFGLKDGTAVADLAASNYSTRRSIDGGVAVYPYDGMTNAEIGFYGNEIPDPLKQFDVEYSGGIISATAEADIVAHTAVITNEAGEEIPYFEEMDGDTLYLFPKDVLEGYQTYTVHLTYQAEGDATQSTKVWSFTTGKGHELVGLSSGMPEIMINEGSSLPLQINGTYNDGVSKDVTAGLTFQSSKPAGMKVTAAGVITGVKAGEYVVKLSSGTVKDEAEVKVLPRLKTKNYAGSDTARLTDIAGHANQEAIEWAVRSGLMTGYADGTFKPDAKITQAQFWVTFLKMYDVNYEAYSPKKKKHWADGAYSIASSRNFPLTGVDKTALKDGAITRSEAAEVIAAADGVHFDQANAIWYLLAKDYARGITERSINGYQGQQALTRAAAAELLQYVNPKLKELLGRPEQVTPKELLPPLPELEVYVKPTVLEDRMVITEFHADRSLTVEGKFTEYAGQQMFVRMGGERSEAIEDITVTLDAHGIFKQTFVGPYQGESLSLYLEAKNRATYGVGAVYSKIIVDKYGNSKM
ncbi:S-layer homology domain-containing protein [Paenibacillus sp. USHLN196]|uniref:CAP and S-layer homology domain-containing protein n=1 Tax=Paenibacillus sp. USHLN196 TaxID=3081291 RepID=UPI003019D298